MTPTEARALLSTLMAAWPSAKWTEPTIALYRSRLEVLEHAEASFVVDRLVGSAKWLPSVGEIEEPARLAARRKQIETRPIDCWIPEAQDPSPWLFLAREILAGRRSPPAGVQLELWEG